MDIDETTVFEFITVYHRIVWIYLNIEIQNKIVNA